jgi:DNA repair and recombination protein RAD52
VQCKKEGTTDALKRALRNFGNVLGNCLYDKTYLREVSKVKAPAVIPFEVNLIYQPRFDLNELHRRPEFAQAVKTVTPPNPPSEDPITNTTLADQPGK